VHAGVAGNAHVILFPELPYDIDRVVERIKRRYDAGRRYCIVVVAEGARPKDGGISTIGEELGREVRLGGLAEKIGAYLGEATGFETRSLVLGHLQRGGSPTPFDRALCSMFGATAVELVASGDFGKMVAFVGSGVGAVDIGEAVGRLKTVPPDGSLARTARALGISLGD
jgi:6-phosphofructokinase 1